MASQGTTLHIDRVEQGHAGLFSCQATNEAGTAGAEVELSVHGVPSQAPSLFRPPWGSAPVLCHPRPAVPPRITLPPSLPGPVLLSAPVRLTCNATGTPSPTLMWLKDGNPVSTAGTSGLQPVTPSERLRVLGEGRLLQIQPTQVSDSGRYLCVATNVAGEDDQDFNVIIQVPPMFQKVGDAGADLEFLSQAEEVRGGVTEYREVMESNPAYLYCDTNAVPAPELTWYREDQPLSATDGASVLQGRLGRRREVGASICRWGAGSYV
ncbi:Hemicentin-1 [Pteropus alecto]|uniref:Hemicentin-1 n=1 Tax=Pteropus alecto TaxID=9402 RepID=L5K940_PTEAL|nr:Hemicentin-1 [Pteropus alecto]